MSGLRQKYRSSIKGRVKRLRKSSAGRSLVYIHSKDLEAVKGLAENRGLKFEHAGTIVGGHVKVRLSGDDSGIDEVARRFGKPMKKRMQTKGLGFDIVIPCDDPDSICQNAELAGISTEIVDGGVKLSGIDEVEIIRFIRQHRLMPESMLDQLIGGEIGGHKSMEVDHHREGRQAALRGVSQHKNPHTTKPAKSKWTQGHVAATGDMRRASSGNKTAIGSKEMEDGEDKAYGPTPEAAAQYAREHAYKPPKPGTPQTHTDTGVGRSATHDNSKPRSAQRIGPHTKSQPSDKIKPAKARQILKDGTVHGHPLTEAQRGLFGAAAGKGEKAMPDETMPEATEPEAAGVETPEEPFGAQVIRSLHQDFLAFMEKYDKVHPHVEHEPTHDHLQKLLERTEQDLTDLEEIFSSEERYKDLPELEGKVPEGEGEEEHTPGMEAEHEEEENPEAEESTEEEADSEEEELPTPEESVQGMKSLKNGKMKSLPAQGKKHSGAYSDKPQPQSKQGTADLGIEGSHKPGFEEYQKKPGKKSVPAQAQSKLGKENLGIEGEHKPGFEEYQDKKSRDLGVGDEGEHEPGTAAIHEEEHSDPIIDLHHRENLDTATGFLKSLSEKQDIEDDDRLEAYHHHKNLEHMSKGLLGAIGGGLAGMATPIPGGTALGAAAGSAVQDRISGNKNLEESGRKIGEQVGGKVGAAAGRLVERKVGKKQYPEADKEDSEVNVTKGEKTYQPGPLSSSIRAPAGANDPRGPRGDTRHNPKPKPSGGNKDFPEMEKEDEESGVQEGCEEESGGMKAWHKHLTDASGFLKQASKEHAWGDHHREKAMACHKALSGVMNEAFPEMEHEAEHSEVGEEPLGEVNTKSLLETQVLQNYAIDRMTRELDRVNGMLASYG